MERAYPTPHRAALVASCFVAAGLSLVTGCGSGSASPATSTPRTGPQSFEIHNCWTCHGMDGGGSSLAPPLRGLSQWWDRESLAEFLAKGRAGAAPNQHVVELREQYRGKIMPGLSVTEAERLTLADWLLTL